MRNAPRGNCAATARATASAVSPIESERMWMVIGFGTSSSARQPERTLKSAKRAEQRDEAVEQAQAVVTLRLIV